MNTHSRIASMVAALVVAAASAVVRAEVKLPALFSDHMVLERGATVPVWGWAAPDENVTVSVAGQQQSTKAGADGKWRVNLANLSASGPQTLTVAGSKTLTVRDVLIGEVWLGSGQSNMAMTVNRAKNYESEQAAANWPQIRMFTVSSGASKEAQEDCRGSWVICSPETVGSFSATLFFFGRDVYQKLNVPVGLINSSVGGTPIESWIDPATQHASTELKAYFERQKEEEAKFDPVAAKKVYERNLARWKEIAAKAKAEKQPVPRAPVDPIALRARKGDVGGLYLGKIAPLAPFAIRGAVWYQGEANCNEPKMDFYQYQLPLLVTDWRKHWGYDFPFAWVQLPNFSRGEPWCIVREAMLKSLRVPNTGMAITIDIGDPKDIHPQNKQDVGKRLAMWALASVYHQPGVAASGPLPAGHELRGAEIVLSFRYTDGGLAAREGDSLRGFEIAGEDHKWQPAQARIAGEQVIASSPAVPKPVAVRYAWKDNPDANLYNGAGLPASPFRTSDW
jgi:sialate O-acetylesterase